MNQQLNLDGFIAEQHHADTFNLDAVAKGSEYRAEVLKPKSGGTYGKNSVDVVIRDGEGKLYVAIRPNMGPMRMQQTHCLKRVIIGGSASWCLKGSLKTYLAVLKQ
ncbi:hypothetical protein LNO23_00245 [Klebsiella pneumoniae subsp. pneumoniae]|nr:hypothetical protein [Klebsiella pneumoniae subsp. pneumoniae]